MTTPREVTAHLPNSALLNADWADAFEINLPKDTRTARAIALATLGSSPKWLVALLALRNTLMKPFGLKAGKVTPDQPANNIGFFPVIEETDERLVVGLDDRHLDFRIVVELETQNASTNVLMTTLIKRHNIFGRLYLAVVSPFHKLIVPRVLAQAASSAT